MEHLKAALPNFRRPPRSTGTLLEHALGSAIIAFIVVVGWIAGMYPHAL